MEPQHDHTAHHHVEAHEMVHSGRGDPGHTNHGGVHAGHADIFRRLFWANLLLAVPVVLFPP